jgi:hypothetical protein
VVCPCRLEAGTYVVELKAAGKCPLIFGGHFGQCLRVLVSVFVDEVPECKYYKNHRLIDYSATFQEAISPLESIGA